MHPRFISLSIVLAVCGCTTGSGDASLSRAGSVVAQSSYAGRTSGGIDGWQTRSWDIFFSESSPGSDCASDHARHFTASIDIFSTDSTLHPGTFIVQPSPPNRATVEGSGGVVASYYDADLGVSFASGTLVLTSADDSMLAGTFSGTLDDDSPITGMFEAPTCDY
jgi:hypothetical protein